MVQYPTSTSGESRDSRRGSSADSLSFLDEDDHNTFCPVYVFLNPCLGIKNKILGNWRLIQDLMSVCVSLPPHPRPRLQEHFAVAVS